MFLPYETSCSMWFAAIPRYEWVPLPPEGEAGEGGPQLQQVAGDSGQTRMKVVFAGIEWVAYPVWQAQANPAWDLCIRNRADEADEHGRERARHAQRSTGTVPSWETPQSPAGDAAAKLDKKEG
jgi:hypothetical protein